MLRVSRRTLLLIVGLVVVALAINLGPWVAGRLTAGKTSNLAVWGANNFGQVGNGTTRFEAIVPLQHQPNMPPARQVALGLNHTIALAEDGRVYGWGSNQYGQIGQGGAIKLRPTPVVVRGLPRIVQVAANQDHSLALDATGHVWAWGLNMSGQLGNGTNTDASMPLKVPGMDSVTQIAAGYRTSLALKRDGSLWAWGGDCQLDTKRDQGFRDTVAVLSVDGSYSTPSTAGAKSGRYAALSPEEDCINQDVVGIKSVRPKRIAGLPRLKTVAAGFGHMLGIDEAGNVWAWGCNTYGQVGNGTVGRGVGANLKPAKVAGMDHAVAVSAGFRHSLVLKSDGSLYAWGHNFTGALGTGDIEDQHPRPRRVPGLPPVRQIAAGHDFSMALTRNGEVWGWGDGGAWQFVKDGVTRRRPAKAWNTVQGKAVQLVAGGGHVAARLEGSP